MGKISIDGCMSSVALTPVDRDFRYRLIPTATTHGTSPKAVFIAKAAHSIV